VKTFKAAPTIRGRLFFTHKLNPALPVNQPTKKAEHLLSPAFKQTNLLYTIKWRKPTCHIALDLVLCDKFRYC
jgi:hypothetical protein